MSDAALTWAKLLVGGNTMLAQLLTERGNPISQQAISQWARVPAERVLEVERVTGVPRSELRPDLYPDDVVHSDSPSSSHPWDDGA